jgi:hypothetical protein
MPVEALLFTVKRFVDVVVRIPLVMVNTPVDPMVVACDRVTPAALLITRFLMEVGIFVPVTCAEVPSNVKLLFVLKVFVPVVVRLPFTPVAIVVRKDAPLPSV